MSTEEKRLYCLPGGEEAYTEIAEVYESEIDPWHDEDDPKTWTVEEWSVQDNLNSVPRVEWLIEWLVEHVAEEWPEGGYECAERAGKHSEVKAAAEALRRVFANKLTYMVCDELLATHTITFVDGEPMVNGEPMYVKRLQAGGLA